jgi:hypothetical protein
MPINDTNEPVDLSALATPGVDVEDRVARRVMAELAERDETVMRGALSVARPALALAATAAAVAMVTLGRGQPTSAARPPSTADVAAVLGVAGPFAAALADDAVSPRAADLLVTYRGR